MAETATTQRTPGETHRIIGHVDMDAFYVAVEVLRDPSLRGKPVIVGGDGLRGVVASCSYEARAYGVRSAMASVQAKRLCPKAIFISGNHALYGEYSAEIHAIFGRFTPLVEGIALDEAFLDLSGTRRRFGSGQLVAERIRQTILDELQLSCCVGIAPNKLLAKLASVAAKPPIGPQPRPPRPGARYPAAGVAVVDPGNELTFLHAHPARSLWGIGPKTFERLSRYGVQTVGDLAALSEHALVSTLGQAHGRHLWRLVNGQDDRPVEPNQEAKSIGHEETLTADVFVPSELDNELLRLSDAVSARVRAAGVGGRTVQLKLKLADFRLITRSKTLTVAATTTPTIYETVKALLHEPSMASLVRETGVRLVGVSLGNLGEVGADPQASDGQQLDLFSPAKSPTRSSESDRVIAGTIDAIRERFGSRSVGPAALVRKGGLRVKQPGDTQWGPSSSPEGSPADRLNEP